MPKKATGLTTQQHGSNTTPVAPATTAEATKQQQSSNTTPVTPVTTTEAATEQQSSNMCTATAMATATLQNSNNSCHSDQVKPHDVAQSKEIFENLNVLSHGERASLKLPEVAFISKQDIQLVQSQNEVSNPL